MEIITRTEAIDRGLKKYFTGKPCINGHISDRYTKTSLCLACHAATQKKERKKISEAFQGISRITLRCPRHRLSDLAAYAEMLLAEAGHFIKAVDDEPVDLPPVPKPEPITEERMLQMWTRVHGETIARQMLEQHRKHPTNGS